MILEWNMVLGVVLGAGMSLIFFGGLWWTLSIMPHQERPRLFFWLSWWIRMSLCLYGFWISIGLGWNVFLTTCLFFYLTRQGMLRRLALGKE